MFLYNRLYWLELIKSGYEKLKNIYFIYRYDYEIVYYAAKAGIGNTLKYTSYKFKNNKKIVLEVVKNSSLFLKFASDELKNNKHIVLTAIKNNYNSYAYASENLQNDSQIINIVLKDTNNLSYSGFLRTNKTIVWEALDRKKLSLIESISNDLLNDYDIVSKAVQINGNNLKYASKELKDNDDIVLEAVKNVGTSIIFASSRLQKDNNMIIESILSSKSSFKLFKYNLNYKLYFLIHNLQYNFNIKLVILNELFLDNINYISKTYQFHNILNFILKNHIEIFKENYKKFINAIINNFDYIKICLKYHIHFVNKDVDIDNVYPCGYYTCKKCSNKLSNCKKIILYY
jgi:hypothetical protein